MNQSEELNKLVDICHSNLKNSKKCLKYLVDERLLTKESIVNNKIGFFPQNPGILTKYVSEELLNKLNILNYSKGSDFSDYFFLVFPIYSEYNKPIGISGRTLLDDYDRSLLSIPKYKNSSYKKSNVLYGLNFSNQHILDSDNAYVVEGYFDQLSMCKNNLLNSVAICGTAFSQGHFLKLARYTNRITFILDSDDAGIKSAQRIYSKYINRGLKLRFLKVPESYKDIDEYFSDPEKNKNTFFKDFKQIIPETW